jgi:hypothetical protein
MGGLEVGPALREAAGVDPVQLVADDPSRVLQPTDETMVGAGAAEGEQVAAGLGDAQGWLP